MSAPSAADASASSGVTPAQLHQSLLQYLTQLQQAGSASAKEAGIVDVEPLAVAIELISEATGVKYDPKEKVVDAGLSELFSLGVSSVRASSSSAKWRQFLDNLTAKTDFFKDAPEGSWEYAKRIEQARRKFADKYGPQAGEGASASAAAPASAASAAASTGPVSEENKAKAEAAKNEGNALLGKQDNQGAASKYTDAIQLNPQHAIYYANRAAAYVNLKEYRKAVADCRASIAIDPAYPKSHYRLGQSYAALNEYEQALDAFNDALERSGKDDGMKVTIREQIAVCTRKMNASQVTGGGQQHTAGADPFAALSSMMGGGGGGGGMDFSSLMNNPMLAGLMNSPEIANMMQNPEMQNMMKNLDLGSLMKDPSMAGLAGGGLGEMASKAADQQKKEAKVDTSYKPPSASDLFDDAPSSGAAAAPAAAAAAAPKPSAGGNVPPQVAAFLSTPAGQAAAADPDLAPVLADIQANGMGAAMKYMQNPKVMQKITAIMGPMMGKK